MGWGRMVAGVLLAAQAQAREVKGMRVPDRVSVAGKGLGPGRR